MTTPTLRDTSQALINILKELHYGSMPERVQTAFDAVQEALAAQPELPEPVGDVDEYGKVKWRGAVHTETTLYTAAQLQQAVEVEKQRADSLFETLFSLCNYLGIDCEDARKAPGKPSDVYKAAIDSKVSQAVEQAQANVATDAAQITREFDELLGDYWDEAYEQGEEGRTHDNNGTAQKILSGLQALFAHALQTQAKREQIKVTPEMRTTFRQVFREGDFWCDRLDYALERMMEVTHHNTGADK